MERKQRKRLRGTTRVSAKGQITIPAQAMRDAGVSPGDVLRVDAEGDRLVVRRVGNPFLDFAGALPGVYRPGELDEMRDEW